MKTFELKAWVVVALAALACGKQATEPHKTVGPVVAKVGDRSIGAGELKEKLNELPPMVRARYATPERKKEFLENLVRSELLLAEARKRGLENDPEVRTALEKVIVQRLLKLETAQLEAKSAPSDDEIKAYYDQHISEYVRPDRIRISHIFFSSTQSGPQREKVKSEAEKALADIKSRETGTAKIASDKQAFAQIARTRSNDEKTKSMDGDLGFHTREELSALWGAPVAEAAFRIASPNDLSGLIASEHGFHLLKLTGKQPGFDQSIESVKPRILGRLAMEKRARALETFVADLRSKTNVTIDEKELQAIEVSASSTLP